MSLYCFRCFHANNTEGCSHSLFVFLVVEVDRTVFTMANLAVANVRMDRDKEPEILCVLKYAYLQMLKGIH
jgi:hypothetical protein